MLTVVARRAAFFGMAGLMAVGVVVVACADATEIQLNLRTDLPCDDLHIAIAVGAPGDGLDTKAPITETYACASNGEIGTVTLIPSGSKSDEIGIRVLAGPNESFGQCETSHSKQCIVARRTLRFTPHRSIALDIPLIGACGGVFCDATHSCDGHGKCVDWHILDSGVYEPDDAGTTDAGVDAELLDAGAFDADAGGDAMANADVGVDGNVDAGVDAGAEAGLDAGTVQCGTEGVRCPLHGNECCLTIDIDAQVSHGECISPELCSTQTQAHFACDDEIDCTAYADDAGHPGMCMITIIHDPGDPTPTKVNGSVCVTYAEFLGDPFAGYGYELCARRQSCLNGSAACYPSVPPPTGGNALPGYAWCSVIKQ